MYKKDFRVRKALFLVENDKVVAPNIITYELVTGKTQQWHIIGCYLPPSEKDAETARRAEKLITERPRGSMSLVLGNLNSNLDFPWDRQEEILSTGIWKEGLGCPTRHLKPQHTRHVTDT